MKIGAFYGFTAPMLLLAVGEQTQELVPIIIELTVVFRKTYGSYSANENKECLVKRGFNDVVTIPSRHSLVNGCTFSELERAGDNSIMEITATTKGVLSGEDVLNKSYAIFQETIAKSLL